MMSCYVLGCVSAVLFSFFSLVTKRRLRNNTNHKMESTMQLHVDTHSYIMPFIDMHVRAGCASSRCIGLGQRVCVSSIAYMTCSRDEVVYGRVLGPKESQSTGVCRYMIRWWRRRLV